MCGRYRLSRRKQLVEQYFGAVSGEDEWNPRYNVAPSQPVLTVRQDAREPVRKLSSMRWGLIPSWAKDPSFRDAKALRRAEDEALSCEYESQQRAE
jgi:putative SOS response-associated peptidase YedK